MKDLYRRNNLRARETDSIKIHNSSGAEEDKEAAFTILLNGEKKPEYDRVHATLSAIGYVRRHLGLAGKSGWRVRYGDFLDPAPAEAAGPGRRRRRLRPQLNVATLLSWPVVGLALLSLLPLAYLALMQGEQDGVAPSQAFDQPMHVLRSGVQVHATPDRESSSKAELREYQDVEVDLERSNRNWAYINLENEGGGFVLRQYLASGSGEAAQVAKCREYGTWRPESGHHLDSGKTGKHSLIVVNPPGQDALVKLKDHEGNTEVFFYVRGGETVTVDTIPEGRFQLQYAVGDNYSPACGRFVDNMRARADPDFMTFATRNEGLTQHTSTKTHTLKSGEFSFSSISNREF